MKSKISFFNKGVFNNLMKRYWPAWALYAAFWILAMPVDFLSNLRFSDNVAHSFVNKMEGMCGEITVILAFAFAVIVVMGEFSYLYFRRETSMTASLPVRREAIFGSTFLAGILPVIAINAIIGVLTLLTVSGSMNSDCINAVLVWFGSYTLEFIAFYGIACFTAMLTGTIIALPAFYVIINFVAVAVEYLIRALIDAFVYGVSATSTCVTEFLSPSANMLSKTRTFIANATEYYSDVTGTVSPQLAFEGWGVIAIYAAAGLVLSICAMLIFRKRKMECTGDVVAIPALKPVFKYAVAFGAAIGFGLLMFLIFWSGTNAATANVVDLAELIFFMAVGAAIGYFGADMLNKKSVHVFKGNWGGFIAVVIVCIVLCALCRIDVFGVGKYVPEASDVKSVTISGKYMDVTIKDPELVEKTVALHQSIVDDLDEIAEDAADVFIRGDYEYYYDACFEYTLENGRRVVRSYTLKDSRPQSREYEELMSLDEIVDERSRRYDSFTADDVISASFSYGTSNGEWWATDLTPVQAFDLYKNAISLDVNEGNLKYWMYGYSPNAFGFSVWIEFEAYSEENNYSECVDFNVDINRDCTHTIQWFKDNLGVDISESISEYIVNPEITGADMPY